jgi:hypothetical protein
MEIIIHCQILRCMGMRGSRSGSFEKSLHFCAEAAYLSSFMKM